MYKYSNEIKSLQRKDCLNYKDFDNENNIDTEGPVKEIIENDESIFVPDYYDNSFKYPGSFGYQPTAIPWLDIVNLYFVNNIKCSEYKFVDVGCGKGKPIFYNIINNIPYKSYCGLEIDNDIFNIFINNIKTINKKYFKYVQALNINALDYKYEEDKCIYFFFKPFEKYIFDELIKKYLKNIINSKSYLVFIFEQDFNVGLINELELVYKAGPVTIYRPKNKI